MTKVLVIGPSDSRSKGGMATVIHDIRTSKVLNEKHDIDIFASYVDGNLAVRALYSVFAFLKFLTIYRAYELFHIHVASDGSTLRKSLYLRVIKRAKKKAVVHVHGADYLDFYARLSDRNKRAVADFLKSADLVIGLSDGWKRELEAQIGLRNCVALPNGIDPERYRGAVCDWDAAHNSFLLLGRLGERKGVYDLIRAVRIAVGSNPDIRVYLAGDGEIQKVRDTVSREKLEKNVFVHGWVDDRGKAELLKKCAALVLPSYHEGLPMSILEGMAAGKAIVSTTVGAIPEVVREENGILIEPGDTDALAAALVRLSAEPETAKRMGTANIEMIDRLFSVKRMHETLLDYYERAAN